MDRIRAETIIQQKIILARYQDEFLVFLPSADLKALQGREDELDVPRAHRPSVVAVYSQPKMIGQNTFEYSFVGVRVT